MKIAIYSRKSVYSDKGESVENQIQMCKDYATRFGANNFYIYEDEGFSGKDTNRPQFKQMMKDARKKKFDMLICYRLDRISRNVADFSKTIDELQKNEISFVSIKEQFDTNSPMGRAMMNVAAVFAQLERETIAERIRDNMMELAKTGRWLGGTSPLGYKSEPVQYKNNDGKSKKMFKLTLVNEEIETVKLIYKLFLEKKGLNSVANHLCREYYKGKNGGNFSRETVRQILCNPVYCIADEKIKNYFSSIGSTVCGEFNGMYGIMAYNKRIKGGKKDNDVDKWIVSVGKHKGVISSNDWIQSQKLLEENKSKKLSPRSGTGEKFLLSGLLICGECGSSMSSWSHFNKKRNVMERYYRCNLKQKASNRCTCKMLNAEKSHEKIIKMLLSLDKKHIEKMIKSNLPSCEENNSKTLVEAIENNNKTIQGLIRKIALLDDDIEILTMFKNEIDNIKKENDKLNSELRMLESSIIKKEDLQKNLNTIFNALDNVQTFHDKLSTEDLRRLIKVFVKHFIWYSDTKQLKLIPLF